MHEVYDLRADESRSHDRVGRPVDHQLGAAHVVLAHHIRTRKCGEVVLDRLDVQALFMGRVLGQTHGPDLGIGEGDLWDVIGICGGGVVACEAATWLNGLGVEELTIIEGQPRLLPRNEPFAGDMVADYLRAAGVRVELGTRVSSVSRPHASDAGVGVPHGGEVTVTLNNGQVIVADEMVVAAGRRANSTGIGLASVGLPEGGYVTVDDHLTVTGVPGEWLYAIGDLNGRALLTHMGKYQARIAADVILGRDARIDGSASGTLSPRVVFTDPQVAAVGHTLESALAAGIAARAVDHDTSGVAGGSFYGRGADGTSRLVVDEARRVLVGATFTGPDVAEFVHTATVAIVGGVTIDQLWHATPSFPTRSEVWLRLLETYGL